MTENIYKNTKLRYIAIYQVSMAARYLHMHPNTLFYWLQKNALLKAPKASRTQLSFVNLVEAHVLSSLRKEYELSMQSIRRALDELRNRWPDVGDYPLATETFMTDGKYLMVEKLGSIYNLNRGSQIEMRELIDVYLRRIDRDQFGPIRLYPFTVNPFGQTRRANGKPIAITPYIGFGQPVAAGTGVPAEIIFGRFVAGETMHELAEDYNLTLVQIEEIIRYEGSINRAA